MVLMERKIGLTKTAGWQFGVRKTVNAPLEYIWNDMFSENGLAKWNEGVDTDFSTFKAYSHVRTKWKLNNWKNKATLQIRLVQGQAPGKTTIAVHIDQLLDENQRREAKEYWSVIITHIANDYR